MTDTTKLILQSTLGRELNNEEAETLDRLMSSRDLADGEYLINEGTVDNSLFVILEGKLEVVKRSGADEVVSLAIIRGGEIAGELSFIDGEVHTVGLRALCASRVLVLQRKDFEGAVEKHPQLTYKVMRAVARSAHRIVHRMNHEYVELSNYIFKQHGRY